MNSRKHIARQEQSVRQAHGERSRARGPQLRPPRRETGREASFAPRRAVATEPRTNGQRQGGLQAGRQEAYARLACGVLFTTRLGRAVLGLLPARLPFYMETP